MPFQNEVIGTNGVLIRNWLQSANYVAGQSGWQITKNGSAEFNNGTFRGSIEVGSLTGQHFIVNNAATGDVVDIYDSTNTLVAKIDKSGEIITTNGTDSALMFGNGFSFVDFQSPPSSYGGMTGSSRSTGSHVTIDSGRTSGGSSSTLMLLDNINGPGGEPTLIAAQRGLSQGAVVQTDSFSATNNYFHAGVYSGTVSGGDGHWVFPHHCNFTPSVVILTPYAAGGGDGPGYVRLWTNFVDATNCYTIWANDGGARTADGTTVGVNAIFVG